jgi:hypothetical protein
MQGNKLAFKQDTNLSDHVIPISSSIILNFI